MATNQSQHISQQFEKELQDIRSRVLAMGGMVEKQVSEAMDALVTGDADLARQVISGDEEVNKLDVSIDEECIQIIALRQPTASDLRLVTGILKTITDLERIGDEAARIARMALNLAEKDRPKKNYRELHALGQHVSGMLHNTLDAFARFDVDAALQVAHEDRQVDAEYESIMALITDLKDILANEDRRMQIIKDELLEVKAKYGDERRSVIEYAGGDFSIEDMIPDETVVVTLSLIHI